MLEFDNWLKVGNYFLCPDTIIGSAAYASHLTAAGAVGGTPRLFGILTGEWPQHWQSRTELMCHTVVARVHDPHALMSEYALYGPQ